MCERGSGFWRGCLKESGAAERSDVGMNMKDWDYWERFTMTGHIDDFLAYRNALEQEQRDRTEEKRDKAGEHSHAGIYRDYGNGYKG